MSCWRRPVTRPSSSGCSRPSSVAWSLPTRSRCERSHGPRSRPTRSMPRLSLVSMRRSSCPRFGCPQRKSSCNGGSLPSAPSWSQMTRLKNRIQSILHANLIPRETGHVLQQGGRCAAGSTCRFPPTRCAWRCAIMMNSHAWPPSWPSSTRSLAQRALDDPDVKRLMTIGGVDAIVAASVLAAIGDIRRFSSPEKLVSYLGLNPSVHQSGDHPAYHGHITHQGRGHARGCWSRRHGRSLLVPGH